MGREDLQRLAAPEQAPVPPRPASPAVHQPSPKPTVPAGVPEYVLAWSETPRGFQPVLYGVSRVHYTDTRRGIDVARSVQATVPFGLGAIPIDWDHADPAAPPPDALT